MSAKVEEKKKYRVLPTDPSERRLWVVSSIDGNLDKLEDAISEIETHQNFCADDRVIFMGGFIGTSLDNKQIIKTLREYQKERHPQVVVLRGAEEHTFLTSKESFYNTELGKAILDSYREKNYSAKTICNNVKLIEDRNWLLTLPSIYKTNRFFFVYKGVTKGKPLDEQQSVVTTFLYDTSFLNDNEDYGKIVVHKHTTNEYKINRIGISTGLIILNDTLITDKITEINT
jgi:hypothetical protein